MPVATIDFAAPLIREALAALQADLPAHLAAFNAEPANTVVLDDPVAYAFGGVDPLGADGFPVVEVAVKDGRTGASSLGNADFDHNMNLQVVAWHEADRGEISEALEKSYGYGRCIVEVLFADEAFMSAVAQPNSLFWRADALPAELSQDGRTFQKWHVPIFLQFTLSTVEVLS